MTRSPVKSSNVKSIGYDSEKQSLEVEFKSGAVYSYAGVSPAGYQALMKAPSKGSFVRQTIIANHRGTAIRRG